MNEFNSSFDRNLPCLNKHVDQQPDHIPTTNTRVLNNVPKTRQTKPTNLGIFSDVRIDAYDGAHTEGKLLRLVYYDEYKRKLELEENTLLLFQKYAAYEVGFVTIFGQKGNGKSLILDKVLNLSGVKGNHFSTNKQQGVFIWSQPFRKRNMKVFLIDCPGFSISGRVDHEYKLFETLMLLCNCVIFNNRNKSGYDDTSKFLDMLEVTRKNVEVVDGQPITKEDKVFPNCLFHLFRSIRPAGSNPFSKYFNQYSFTFLEDAMANGYTGKQHDLTQCSFLTTGCISQKYIRHISEIFRQVLQRMEEKSVQGVSLNGNIAAKFITALCSSINKDPKVSVNKIFRKIVADLYASAYNFCVITYSELLEQRLVDESPKPLDELLDIFMQASEETLLKYNQFNLDPELHKQYMTKLQDHIQIKEKLILQINKKKTQNTLRSEFKLTEPNTKLSLKSDQARRKLQQFRLYRSELDHGREEVMIEIQQQLIQAVVGNIGNYQLQKTYDLKLEQVQKLQKTIDQAKQKNSDMQSDIAEEQRVCESKKQAQKRVDKQIKDLQAQINSLKSKLLPTNSSIANPEQAYEASIKESEQLAKKLKTQLENLKVASSKPANDDKAQQHMRRLQEQGAMLMRKQQDSRKVIETQQIQIQQIRKQIDAKIGNIKKK